MALPIEVAQGVRLASLSPEWRFARPRPAARCTCLALSRDSAGEYGEHRDRLGGQPAAGPYSAKSRQEAGSLSVAGHAYSAFGDAWGRGETKLLGQRPHVQSQFKMPRATLRLNQLGTSSTVLRPLRRPDRTGPRRCRRPPPLCNFPRHFATENADPVGAVSPVVEEDLSLYFL